MVDQRYTLLTRQQPTAQAGNLQLARVGRRVWLIDCGPAANVDRRVHVGMGGEPTGLTGVGLSPPQATRLQPQW